MAAFEPQPLAQAPHHQANLVYYTYDSPTLNNNGSTAEVDEMIAAFQALGTNMGLAVLGLYFFGTLIYVAFPSARIAAQAALDDAELEALRQEAKRNTNKEHATLSFLRSLWSQVRMTFLLVKVVFTCPLYLTQVALAGVFGDKTKQPNALEGKQLDGQRSRLACVGRDQQVEVTSEIDAMLRSGEHGVKHMAIIMDGNRRYGKKLVAEAAEKKAVGEETATHGKESPSSPTSEDRMKKIRIAAQSPLNGHRLGGDKLMEVIDWSIEHRVKMLTVYAFSTENWNRSQEEIDLLMSLFEFFFQKIRDSARTRGIFIRFVATDPKRLPRHVYDLMVDVERETSQHSPRNITVNVCVSYGGRGEIVNACNSILEEQHQASNPNSPTSSRSPSAPSSPVAAHITEEAFTQRMMRSITEVESKTNFEELGNSENASNTLQNEEGAPAKSSDLTAPLSEEEEQLLCEPQVMMRTSGEQRVSNFMLYQCAYSELIFLNQTWPEVDLVSFQNVLIEFMQRQRRFGK